MRAFFSFVLCGAGLFWGGRISAQDRRAVQPPHAVRVCTRLTAHWTVRHDVLPAVDEARPDTRRIQRALDLCLPGEAVELHRGAHANAFLSGPLILPRGVTLFVDRGITVFASRRARDYDLSPGSCGRIDDNGDGCKPLLLSYQAAYSSVMGEGVIDGRGGFWWDLLRRAAQTRRRASVPDLIAENESNDFILAGITLRNPARSAAAIIKSTGFTAWGVTVDGPKDVPEVDGLDLVSTRNVTIRGSSIHTGGADIHIASDRWIFPSADITIEGNRLDEGHGVVTESSAPGVQRVVMGTETHDDAPLSFSVMPATAVPRRKARVIVAADGSGDVTSVQAAVNELPDTGGTVVLRPGTYREVVTVRKPHVRFIGSGRDSSQVVIVFGNYAGKVGGTFNSATMFVEADDFRAGNLTIANDYDPLVHPHEGGQAVALAVTADRAVFRHVRLLGRQDTLFLNSRYCYSDVGPCQTTRQLFADSYIEGNVDFIFGDSRAVFENCILHGLAGNVMYTAQDKRYPDEPSGYVFDRCTLTADPGAKRVALGRPWRRYSTVVYLHCRLNAPIVPEGWLEWRHDGKPSLPTAYYAEFDSAGPGASPATREPYAKPLTAKQAAAFATVDFLGGWNPAGRQ